MMMFNRRYSKTLYRFFILILLSSIYLLKDLLLTLKIDSSFNPTHIITPFEQSLLFPVYGRIKYLGKASRIFIINLPSRPDRRTESIALMQTLDLQASIVPAYSIHSPDILILNRNRNSLFFKLTELACWASHMRVWITIVNKTFSENCNTWSIIFEDDIDLEIDLPYIIQTIPYPIWNHADLIYLGHCANPPGKLIYETSKHMYRIHQALHPSCTHAYIIRSDAAKKLVKLLSKPSRPIDDSIIKLVNDRQLVAYSIHPPLAIQKAVSKTNPSDVNKTNRQSWIYRIRFAIYTFLHWWNGVKIHNKLQKSAFARANLTKAKSWRLKYEKEIWKNYF
ncbi:unnamed protein product [Rotaria magnacalcarata]|uniref:Glycosyl transferase family 25 domain-containing protein n=1 Tax=Rotaria magnacalcarata TaxID=392030 RepID=A0A815WYF9_9BILA|nr:unnamed protein product [Rotaria magnacalcarata]